MLFSDADHRRLAETLAHFRAASLWQYRNDDHVPFTLDYVLFQKQRAELEKQARLVGVAEWEIAQAQH